MEHDPFRARINKRKLRRNKSAEQLKVFHIKKRKKCKHKDIICRIPSAVPPRISVWTILNEEHAIKIKVCPMNVKIDIIRHICDIIYKKKKEKRIMRDLYYEVLRFCLKRNYSPLKIATLFGMYHATHQYFTSSLWHDYEETYNFFKETLFVHSINDPPESVLIFSIVDVRTILQRFTSLYLPVLPLLRETILPNVRLWMYWHECRPDIPLTTREVDMSGMKVEADIFTGRSDWDPWDIIQRDELFNEKQNGDYIYDTSHVDLDIKGQDDLDLFGEEENTSGSEEESEDKYTRLSYQYEGSGEEEGSNSDDHGDSQDVTD